MLAKVDAPARYRLGQYLRASLRDPDDRDAYLEWVSDADIYSLWQGLDRARAELHALDGGALFYDGERLIRG